MASPPKPWELSGATSVSGPVSTMSSAIVTTTPSADAPQLPERPASLAASVNQNAAAYSRVGMNAATPYSPYNTGYQSPYQSPYNRFGSYGGYGGGMYGSGYGGYGGGMYGAGGMYGNGMPGGMPNPNDPNSLTNRFNQSTQATFQMLEGIVGAFGGFAQMLESTYMATHSSFFAMISVAQQFSNLRDTLGSVLGVFAIVRWVKTLFAKLTGRPLPADAMSLTPAAFARFEGRGGASGSGPARASRKPLLFFMLAAFGLPFLMNKLIKSIAEKEERKRSAMVEGSLMAHAAQPAPAASSTSSSSSSSGPVDASQLEFCRVLYDFVAAKSGSTEGAVAGVDLEVRKGDIVAVLSKTDPFGNASEWWRCRSRDGRMGYMPSTYLQTVRKPGQPTPKAIAAPPSESSRANSLSSSSIGSRMSTSLKSDISKATTPEPDMQSTSSFRTFKGL